MEQDKPTGRTPRPRSVTAAASRVRHRAGRVRHTKATPQGERFPFAFDGIVGWAARAIVMDPMRAYVEVGEERVIARFGPWVVDTTKANIAEMSITGPYPMWKVGGPPHISLADRGLTFATNADRGVCLQFFEPVTGIEPTGHIHHPGLTVTVADPEALIAALAS